MVDEAEFQRIAAVEQEHWWFRATRAVIADQIDLPARRGGRFLDVGCGPGASAGWLTAHGDVTGLDVSEAALRLLRERHPAVRGVLGTATRLPFADGEFDVVLDVTAFYAIADHEAAFAEAARVLRPGGVAVFFEPALGFLLREHDRAVGTLRRYRRSELARHASRAGLDVGRATYVHAALLPAAAALAALDRARPGARGPERRSDTEREAFAALFARAARVERRLLRRRDLPFGVSAMVVATKPAP